MRYQRFVWSMAGFLPKQCVYFSQFNVDFSQWYFPMVFSNSNHLHLQTGDIHICQSFTPAFDNPVTFSDYWVWCSFFKQATQKNLNWKLSLSKLLTIFHFQCLFVFWFSLCKNLERSFVLEPFHPAEFSVAFVNKQLKENLNWSFRLLNHLTCSQSFKWKPFPEEVNVINEIIP